MAWSCKLGGYELALRPGTAITWALTYGVQPQTTTIAIKKGDVDKILRRGRKQFPSQVRTRDRSGDESSLTLEIVDTADSSRNVTQQGLYLIGVGPGDELNTQLVQLADRRWLAPRTVVRRTYNQRRESGTRRLLRASELTAIQLGVSAPDYVFRRATLKDGRPWTAREVLGDVLEEVFGPGGYDVPTSLPGLSDDVESLELYDRGDEALSRVLALIPGYELFVDYDGKVKVACAYDGSELKMLRSLPKQNAGSWVVSNREAIVPQSFRVFAQVETELRFDFVESTGTRTRQEPGRESLLLENVIINPVLELTLADGTVSTYGEALPIETFLAAINLLISSDGLARPEITQADLRRVWLGDWAGWSTGYLTSAASGAVRTKWQTILSALRSHWRRTYRVLPQWRDKIQGLRAIRVAILDPENGTRAPATVHAQWIMRISQLGLEPRFDARQNLLNDDYSSGELSGQVSPFSVVVLSSDQGLIQLIPRTDEDGVAQGYTLGTVAANAAPTADIRDALVLWSQVPLSSGLSIAVVMSAIKDVPNGTDSLYPTTVTLAQAAAKLGVQAPQASGPDYELRIFEDRARFAWTESNAESIRQAYFDGAQMPADALVNKDAIESLALAHAARKLSDLIPRALGTVRIPMRPVKPTGSVRSVVHTLSVPSTGIGARGETTVSAPGVVNSPSVWSLLPEGVRRVLRQQVER